MCSVVGKQISVHAGRDFVVSSSSPTHRAGPCSSSLHLFNVYEWRRLWSPHSFFIMKRLEPSNRYFLLKSCTSILHIAFQEIHMLDKVGNYFHPAPRLPYSPSCPARHINTQRCHRALLKFHQCAGGVLWVGKRIPWERTDLHCKYTHLCTASCSLILSA